MRNAVLIAGLKIMGALLVKDGLIAATLLAEAVVRKATQPALAADLTLPHLLSTAVILCGGIVLLGAARPLARLMGGNMEPADTAQAEHLEDLALRLAGMSIMFITLVTLAGAMPAILLALRGYPGTGYSQFSPGYVAGLAAAILWGAFVCFRGFPRRNYPGGILHADS